MENLTASMIWVTILSIASAVVLLSTAGVQIANIVKAFKAPNVKQDARLEALEEWRRSVDGKLERDNARLDNIDEGNRATQRALLALLDHGIDGNNIKQMQDAKEALQNHLINR